MAENIFQNPTKRVPSKDADIVRVDMEQQDIGGRKSHLPDKSTNEMTISHIPNRDSRV